MRLEIGVGIRVRKFGVYFLRSSAKSDTTTSGLVKFVMSFIKRRNRIGPRTLPCGTPLVTETEWDD